jgi:hypothetical protein
VAGMIGPAEVPAFAGLPWRELLSDPRLFDRPLDEQAAYWRVMLAAWGAGGPLPADPGRVALRAQLALAPLSSLTLESFTAMLDELAPIAETGARSLGPAFEGWLSRAVEGARHKRTATAKARAAKAEKAKVRAATGPESETITESEAGAVAGSIPSPSPSPSSSPSPSPVAAADAAAPAATARDRLLMRSANGPEMRALLAATKLPPELVEEACQEALADTPPERSVHPAKLKVVLGQLGRRSQPRALNGSGP